MGGMSAARRLLTLTGYAGRDLAHERLASVLSVAVFAVIALPAALLYALQYGYIADWRDTLSSRPRVTEVIVDGEYQIDREREALLRNLEGARFVVFSPRYLTSDDHPWRNAEGGFSIEPSLRTTAPGDPVTGARAPLGMDRVILSAAAARDMEVGPGDSVRLSLKRYPKDRAVETRRPVFTVEAVLEPQDWDRSTVFTSEAMAAAIESFVDFDDDLQPGWTADTDRLPPKGWASFRIYAEDIDGVTPLRARLASLDYDVRVREADIADMDMTRTGLERLSSLFGWVAGAGFAVAALLLQSLSIERKRAPLALLMAGGFSRRAIAAFPLVQAALLSALGCAGAIALCAGMLPIAERYLSVSGTLPRPPAPTVLLAVAGATFLSVLGCAGALWRLRSIKVWEALRND